MNNSEYLYLFFPDSKDDQPGKAGSSTIHFGFGRELFTFLESQWIEGDTFDGGKEGIPDFYCI